MSDEVRFAIVGAGMVARYHAEAIARTPGARLVAITRGNQQGALEAAARFGVPCEPDYDAILTRGDVDAVCICTPSGLHAAQTIAAAAAGKHVLVEKPMALNLADADAMIAACRDAGVRLGVVLQRRADPALCAVQTAISEGTFGRPILGTISLPYLRAQSYYDSAAWRGTWQLDGGGVLMNQGIHLVDLLLWFMGDVAEVRGEMATLARTIEVEDCAAATLRFTSGALGSIVATTAAAPGFPHRVEVYGTAGGVQIAGEQIVRWESAGQPAVELGASPAADAGAGASPTGISGAGHLRILADFVAAVREQRMPVVPGEEGRRSLALVLAIYQAARTGQAVRPD